MITNLFSRPVYILLFGLLLSSCASYKQNIMFRVADGQAIQREVAAAEKNYAIQKNDQLEIQVYTNGGERIIDPDGLIQRQANTQAGGANNAQPETPTYLVDLEGKLKLPMIGEIKLEGLTLRLAEEILQKKYTEFYEQPFVKLRYRNKRVVVLGAPGGQVIPLTNDNTTLVEVLALARGVSNDAKAHNIRVLRGDKVFVADLTTFDGYLKNNLIIEPNDIVYVEPIRRPLIEGLRDYAPVLTIISTIITLALVVTQL